MINNFTEFLNESIASSNCATPLKSDDVEINGIDDVFADYKEHTVGDNFVANWSLDLDKRSTGINSFGVVVDSIQGTYIYNEVNEVDFSSKDYEINCELESNLKFGDPLFPRSLVIDLKTKNITVIF